MGTNPPPETSAAKRTDALQVLLVTRAPEEPDGWADAEGAHFELSLAPSVAAAAATLAGVPMDVVVLDAALAAAEADELPGLLERRDRAAVLVRVDGYTPEIPLLLERLGGTACLMPAGAPGPVQAQIVALAAERARLEVELLERVEELEQRTRERDESRFRFRDVIERNADAIVVVDGEGVIRFGNAMAAELFRSRREDLPGTSFGFPVVAGETTELDLLHPVHPRVVEMRVVESEWEGQTAYIASLRDITDRKLAEGNARRLIREQAARAAAETSAQRFRFLAEASALLSHRLDYTATLTTLARLCVAEVADWAVIYVVDDAGRVQRLEAAHRDAAKAQLIRALRDHPIEPGGGHPVLEVLRTRAPLLVNDMDEERLATIAQDGTHLELMRRLGVASFMLVPLVAHDRGLGAIGLISSDPGRQFTAEDLAEANDLALRAALAVDNARLYAEAQKANQAKTDLLAVISHDLRTPLNSIVGHADLLTLGIPETLGAGSLQHVERIRIGATHLLYLIDQLLSFARLDSGREELRFQEVDAGDVAREVAAVVEPLAVERALAFHLDVPAHPIPLSTDPDRLRQVLLNLVGNAIRYTEAGEVRLELCPSAGEEVAFRVRDTGIGIRPEHLERIFEPFWQVDSSQRANHGGTGLGLSVVRRLVRLLGGEVTVESVVGRGSTFTARLPTRPGGRPAAAPVPSD